MLDMFGGIDFFYFNGKSLLPFAVRIQQYGNKDFESFTVRNLRESGTKSDYYKFKQAIQNNALMPTFSIQAYLNEDEDVLAVYMAQTRDLIEFIDKGYADRKQTYDGTSFWICDVGDLKRIGYKVGILKAQERVNV